MTFRAVVLAAVAVVCAGADMESLLTNIAAFEDGQDRKPLVEFAGLVSDSLGSPTRLKEIEQRLLRLVQSSATRAGKDFALRQLSIIGTDASVSVLAAMINEKDTGEMARYALARIPGPAASAALRQSLPRTPGNMKIALVNSLGQRRDVLSVPALSALMTGEDARLAESAASALARIANHPALAALSAARNKVSPALRPHILEAYVQCADQISADGENAAALKVYRELLATDTPETIRIRALVGLASVAGKDAVPALTAELESKAPKVQAAAIRLLNQIPGEDITRILASAFPKLAPTAQVRLLAALADRGGASARPLFPRAANHQSAQVRVAALEGLASMGDDSSLQLLAEAAANREGAEQAAARDSLYRMRGKEIDSALVSAIGASSGKVQAELITAAGERGITAAADALLKAASSEDGAVRRPAIRALRNAGGPAQVSAVIELLTRSSDSADRREASRTLAALIRDAEPAQTRSVLDACQSASSVEVRALLLEVIGQAPSDEALPLLRASLRDPNFEVSRAAALALSEWNTPAPMPDLLAIAKSNENSALQVLALRGYIKLVSIPAGRPDPESVRLLSEAMRLAARPEEKRAILAILPGFICRESLTLASEYLSDPALSKEAKVAADRLSAALRQR